MLVELRNIKLVLLEQLLAKGLVLEAKSNPDFTQSAFNDQKDLMFQHLQKYNDRPEHFVLCVYEERKNYITAFNGGFYENGMFYYLYFFNLSPSLFALDLIFMVTKKAIERFGNLKAKIFVNKKSRFQFYTRYLNCSEITETDFGMELITTLQEVISGIRLIQQRRRRGIDSRPMLGRQQ